ncbi:MAG: N-acetyltransferase family protein [Bdellovibrionota bacterium]
MIKLRRAGPEDVAAIQAVHKNSIEKVASAFYPMEIISAWSAGLGSPDKILQHETALRQGSELAIVAEDHARILGFGTIVPSTGELRAVYVSSSATRAGIGTKILSSLEEIAVTLGIQELHMDASLSAEAFYLAHRFIAEERKLHRLSNGSAMVCIPMRKKLPTRASSSP